MAEAQLMFDQQVIGWVKLSVLYGMDIVLSQDNNVGSSLKPVDSVTHRFLQTQHYAADKGNCLTHTHARTHVCF